MVHKISENLKNTHPQLALQANGWDPTTLSAGSHKKLSWRGPCGHVWDAVVSSRALGGRGCPFCANRQILVGYNDLATTQPELAAEADGWDPTTVLSGSGLKKSWKCREGHTWETTVGSRTSGSGCPFCSGHRVWAGFNDLATLYPELAKQADGWDPSTVSRGSDLKKSWKCNEGHTWQAAISSRALGNSGCPVCSNQKMITGINDLASRYPEIAKQADGWDPSTTHMHSTRKLQWKCAKGHQWTSTVNSRAKMNLGCPICSGQQLLPGYNDLATTHPQLIDFIVHGDPTSVSKGSRIKFTWKCSEGHEFQTEIYNVTLGKWCPFCGGQKVMPGFNDFATKFPDLALEAHGWDPTTKSFGSGEKLEWKCPKHHIYKAGANARGKGNGCPYCAQRKMWPGFNDLQTTHPEIAAEADGWEPASILNGSTKRLSWKCSLGHVWVSSPSSRISRGSGCPTCAGFVVLPSFNDLQSKFPEVAAEADGWDPSTVTAFTRKRKKWKCSEGHSWTARISGRTYMGAGCPTCSKAGFDPNKDGYLYFLFHDEWDMYQIGITNFPAKRLHTHQLLGWTVNEVRGPMDGHLAQNLETAMLRSIRKRGAQSSNHTDIKKFDGWTEAWTRESLIIKSLGDLMEFVYEDD